MVDMKGFSVHDVVFRNTDKTPWNVEKVKSYVKLSNVRQRLEIVYGARILFDLFLLI